MCSRCPHSLKLAAMCCHVLSCAVRCMVAQFRMVSHVLQFRMLQHAWTSHHGRIIMDWCIRLLQQALSLHVRCESGPRCPRRTDPPSPKADHHAGCTYFTDGFKEVVQNTSHGEFIAVPGGHWFSVTSASVTNDNFDGWVSSMATEQYTQQPWGFRKVCEEYSAIYDPHGVDPYCANLTSN